MLLNKSGQGARCGIMTILVLVLLAGSLPSFAQVTSNDVVVALAALKAERRPTTNTTVYLTTVLQGLVDNVDDPGLPELKQAFLGKMSKVTLKRYGTALGPTNGALLRILFRTRMEIPTAAIEKKLYKQLTVHPQKFHDVMEKCINEFTITDEDAQVFEGMDPGFVCTFVKVACTPWYGRVKTGKEITHASQETYRFESLLIKNYLAQRSTIIRLLVAEGEMAITIETAVLFEDPAYQPVPFKMYGYRQWTRDDRNILYRLEFTNPIYGEMAERQIAAMGW